MGFIAGATALLVPGDGHRGPPRPGLLRCQRHPDRRRLDRHGAGHGTDEPAAVLGRGDGCPRPRHRPGRRHQLGHVGRVPAGPWHVLLFAEQAGPGRNLHRPGHGHQALPPADPRRGPAAGPPDRAHPGAPGHRRGRNRGLAGRQPPGGRRQPGRLEVLLPVHAGAAGGLQLPLVRLQPGGRPAGLEPACRPRPSTPWPWTCSSWPAS